ncbi:hypothetical protein IMZ08_10375 [Bacillus luteolus]|uniref:Uncharacterized protein n=1 Tax=Litchfieldia luteola TaxID=682179 RepID=A0ABR9QIZ1_9BACI|nr:hypothetical protein [Cytobacillus luteolus]MBE4908460.1 hypothetical protein [Cytobacillus luteolus]MBP1941311.1 hypothetical protein [Cytobacillus luteolus]
MGFFVKFKSKINHEELVNNNLRNGNTPFEVIKWMKAFWQSEDFYDKEKFNGMIQEYDAYYPNE